ncbi:MAG: hypothetical protein ACE5EL_00905 [Anaerolineae bacterium]
MSRPRSALRALPTVVPAVLVLGCGAGAGAGATATPAATATVIFSIGPGPAVEFEATAAKIQAGACTTLRWDVKGATSIQLEGIDVPATGSQEVCPGGTTMYVLTAVDAEGNDAAEGVTVEVQQPTATITPTPEPTSTPRPVPPTKAATTAPTAVPTPQVSVVFYGKHGDRLPADQLCTEVIWETRGVTDVEIKTDDGPREAVAASGRKFDLCFSGDLAMTLYWKLPDGSEQSRELVLRHEDSEG